MKIIMHSGHCCAIKTIHGLGESPLETAYLKQKSSKDYLSVDREGGEFSTSYNFYWKERPTETYGERFDAYLEYLATIRPYGLVEVAIVTPVGFGMGYLDCDILDELEDGTLRTFGEDDFDMEDDYEYDQLKWVPFLEERGFKCVSKVPNSNSGNLVSVFHLVMDSEYHNNKKKEK